ncbi:TetR/AcrR family transcriptional regulator [Candidatus Contubernalis alkaliaceticus]|uniref:TetR/AcrR family transcriptional regulator n=1 Tax=Candidatus Contubernalis alkaliaceticus TaxID=338645 RepID=UPI001F4C050B|nr:TetR/AcrR family transcriptional regulator [Candidatus Contubernalis alkalaceticus]UNC92202.1 TetR/AcrR family transcriptional regulator [Candidatus Contubernalis alkalaceticus]
MIQPSVYSYSQIIEAAFQLIREQGWSAVSARAIAKKLGSSTMPIYSHVSSIEELEKKLRIKARELLKEFQQQQYTEHTLLNLAFGYVVFARDEKNLFRFLYLESPEMLDSEDTSVIKKTFFKEFGEDSAEGKALLEMKESGQETLVQYTWIFTHGLAMLVNSGAFGSNSDQAILRFLMDAGEAFYVWGINKEEERQTSKKEQK